MEKSIYYFLRPFKTLVSTLKEQSAHRKITRDYRSGKKICLQDKCYTVQNAYSSLFELLFCGLACSYLMIYGVYKCSYLIIYGFYKSAEFKYTMKNISRYGLHEYTQGQRT